MDTSTIRECLNVAHRAADAAAPETLSRFRVPLEIENKALKQRFDPVTEGDRAAERVMREIVAAHRPNDAILGEEYGYQEGTSGVTWVFDPIDGTQAFVSGLPLWGTLIAVNNGIRPVIGMLDQPYLKERFLGTPEGATMNGTAIRVRACADIADATLSTTGLGYFKGDEKDRFLKVEAAARLTRYGYDCYAYAMIASGYMDAVIEAGLGPYDIQPLIPIVEGAGGIVTNWQGGDASAGGQVVACGDKRLHAQILALLNA